MHVVDAIKKRCSVRQYKNRDVEDEKLREVLESGRLAPSAGNRQEWRYVVVRDAAMRQKLREAAGGQSFVSEAPVVIACCAESDGHLMKCGRKSYPIDCAISIDHMTLRAVELDLGTCWVGAFDADAARKLLGIPEKAVVVQLLTLGYPAGRPDGRPPAKKRMRLDDMVHYEKW